MDHLSFRPQRPRLRRLLSHQIGGFFGAWLGGVALTSTGSYASMWYPDIALALGAALVNVPIEEAPLRVSAAPA